MLSAIEAAEQKRLLRNETNRTAQRRQRNLTDVHAVDEHRARRRVVQARQQTEERRLPGPGRADDRRRRAGRNGQRHVVKHLDVAVAERQVTELDRAAESW